MSTDPLHSREVVVGVSGGIAAYKAADLVSRLRQRSAAPWHAAACRWLMRQKTFSPRSPRVFSACASG